eukprot:TRINITY_DN10091_c0_g1_i7.p1 TRINITY_DN10091_c0_g1~~TRINITY_DN10091_c0_g1_i7.p1  ORF type:complete len:212 (-),score=48.15 TRINITY_DN10091_c0_g1_i7:111-698(-)
MCIRDRYQRRVHGYVHSNFAVINALDDYAPRTHNTLNVQLEPREERKEPLSKFTTPTKREENYRNEEIVRSTQELLRALGSGAKARSICATPASIRNATKEKRDPNFTPSTGPRFGGQSAAPTMAQSMAQSLGISQGPRAFDIERREEKKDDPSPSIEEEADESVHEDLQLFSNCLLYTSPSPRDLSTSRMPSSA